MSNQLTELLTQENITLALSIFGSVGALVTFISSYLSKRKNLKINITSSTYKKIMRKLILMITFENRSSLPIAVTSISTTLHNTKIEPVRFPHCVGEYTQRNGNEVIDRKFTYNLQIPVDIQQFGATSGYILFDISPEDLRNLSTPLILQFHSTRGRVQQIELQPSQIKWI